MRRLLLLCCLWLGGCAVTSSPPHKAANETVSDSELTPPLIGPPQRPPSPQTLDVVKRYRDTLVAYHTYLAGYINYISTSNGLLTPLEQEKLCNVVPVYIDIALPPIPKIADLSDDVAIDRLVDHIETLRNKIIDHNKHIAELRKATAKCAK